MNLVVDGFSLVAFIKLIIDSCTKLTTKLPGLTLDTPLLAKNKSGAFSKYNRATSLKVASFGDLYVVLVSC